MSMIHNDRAANASRSRGFALGVFLFAAAAFSRAESLPNPQELGPYPVGITTMEFVDHSRIDVNTKEDRTLLTEIWYPATDDSRGLPKNQFSDFFLRGQAPELEKKLMDFLKTDAASLNGRFADISVRDARIRDGKFPLIVFSHGNGGVRVQNATWCAFMASHGYVIMSPDHTGNCAATVVNCKVVEFKAGAMMTARKDRPLDVSFLIDQMTRMSRGADSRFNGRVDMDAVGVAGHSFGGLTSAAMIDVDPRVKAIIPMAPVWPTRKNFTTPVLIFVAAEDKTLGLLTVKTVRGRFEESKGPHFMVDEPDAGHYSFTEMYRFDPKFGDGVGTGERLTVKGEPVTYIKMDDSFKILNSYSAAFFGIYLKGQQGYMDYMMKNHFEGLMELKAIVPPPAPPEAAPVAGEGAAAPAAVPAKPAAAGVK